MLNGNDNQLGI